MADTLGLGKGDPPAPSASAKDIRRDQEIDSRLKDPRPLPPHLAEHERKPSRVDVEVRISQSLLSHRKLTHPAGAVRRQPDRRVPPLALRPPELHAILRRPRRVRRACRRAQLGGRQRGRAVVPGEPGAVPPRRARHAARAPHARAAPRAEAVQAGVLRKPPDAACGRGCGARRAGVAAAGMFVTKCELI